jgi:SET domain
VTVEGDAGHRSVVALKALAVGDVVVDVQGIVTTKPTRYSIQVGEFEHVDLPAGLDPARVMAEHPWQFMNHGCDPNVRLIGRQLFAIKAIRAGDAITFNYNTTEYEMATPFTCRCGAKGCRAKRIAGFRHLTSAEQRALLPLVTDALRGRVARESASTRVANRG